MVQAEHTLSRDSLGGGGLLEPDDDDDDDNYDDNYDDDDDEDDDNCLMTSLVVSVRSVPPWQHGRDVVQVLSPHF